MESQNEKAKKEPQVMAVTVSVAWRQRVELQDLSLDVPHPPPRAKVC